MRDACEATAWKKKAGRVVFAEAPKQIHQPVQPGGCQILSRRLLIEGGGEPVGGDEGERPQTLLG